MSSKLTKEITETTLAIAKIEGSISVAIAKFQDKLSTLRERENELRAALLKTMEDNGIPKLENDVLKITYVAPSTRSSIDVTKLREEMPEVAEKYMKSSTIKSSVRIKVKEIK